MPRQLLLDSRALERDNCGMTAAAAPTHWRRLLGWTIFVAMLCAFGWAIHFFMPYAPRWSARDDAIPIATPDGVTFAAVDAKRMISSGFLAPPLDTWQGLVSLRSWSAEGQALVKHDERVAGTAWFSPRNDIVAAIDADKKLALASLTGERRFHHLGTSAFQVMGRRPRGWSRRCTSPRGASFWLRKCGPTTRSGKCLM
jgi:hypothetical protein